MIHLDSFSALFEIAATLNVAYIAVDYSTTFTISVAKNVFRFHDRITKGIARCKKHIDEDTINSIGDVILNGHSISHKIEKAKRDSTKLKRDISNLSCELASDVEEKCKLTCFSSICLHLFLYCIAACVIMGYSNNTISSVCWSLFVFLSVVYTGLMFYFGEIRGKLVDFCQSIKNNSVAFIIICLMTWILVALFHNPLSSFVENIWEIIVPVSALYPFLFFVLFIFILKRNSKTINTDIEDKIGKIEKRCVALEVEVSKLVSTHELSIEVEGLQAEIVPPQRRIAAPQKTKAKQKRR